MKPRLSVLSCVVALGLSQVVAAVPASAAGTSCGGASYGSSAPVGSTHYGAATIRAVRTTCPVAKQVALASEGIGGERYVSKGFRCVPRALESSGARRYVCTKIKKPREGLRPKVTFKTLGNG